MSHAHATIRLSGPGNLTWQTPEDLVAGYRAHVAEARRRGLAKPCNGPEVMNPNSWPHYDITPAGKPPRSIEVFVVRGELFLRESKQTAQTILSRWFALGSLAQS